MQQRVIMAVLGVLIVGGVAYLALHERRSPEPVSLNPAESASGSSAAVASASASASASVPTGPQADAGAAPSVGSSAPVELDELQQVLRGGPVPPLPRTAPNSVVLSIILVTHEDAEFAPKRAPNKRAAYERAKALLTEAQADFKETLKKGDPGSTLDAGRIPRGVLEPALEYVTFTLEKGATFPEPLDTPRGFWIVRRVR